jgi:serralysin
MQKLPASASAQDRNGFQALNAAQKLAVQKAFDYLSSLINVRFVLDESAGEGGADINFGVNDQWGSSGYANPPNGSGDHNVFLMLDKASVSSQALVPGQYGWHTLIHEIGHTLGLKHPGNYNATAGAMPGPFLPKALDNDRYTVMSYLSPTDAGDVKLTISPSAGQISRYEATAQTLYASTYMLYDIAALQFIYGAAPAPSAPQDTSLRFEKDWRGLQTQYFPNNGTLDFSQIERANVIDLRPGAYSSVNVLGPSLGAYLSSLPSLPASTMSYLKSNQTYLGFNNLGLAYGSQMDRVVGGQASDRIYVGTDSIEDQLAIDGGAGEDTVFLPGVATDWALNGETQGNTVANSARNLQTGIQVQLTQIEKIRFYNESTTPLTHSSMDLMA